MCIRDRKWVPWDDPTNDKVGNILLSRMMGADSRLDDAGFDIGIRDSWKDAPVSYTHLDVYKRQLVARGLTNGQIGLRLHISTCLLYTSRCV